MKILVAVDESQASHQALEQALRLINLQGATILLLCVEEPVVTPFAQSSSLPGVFVEDTLIGWQEETELVRLEEKRTQSAIQWAEHLCGQVGVPYATRSELGDPKQIICEVAKQEESDLIVVGTQDHGMVERVLMGSVSDYVVHHAHCPVLVVR